MVCIFLSSTDVSSKVRKKSSAIYFRCFNKKIEGALIKRMFFAHFFVHIFLFCFLLAAVFSLFFLRANGRSKDTTPSSPYSQLHL